jgi:hypothetical protein
MQPFITIILNYFFEYTLYYSRKEIQQIRGSAYIRAILLSFVVIQIRFQIFISILAYILLGHYMNIKKVS